MRTIKKRRRLEGKTDYRARLGMLKSNKSRVVFRKTNKYIIGQFIKSDEAQDKVSIGISSKDLEGFGWPKEASGSLKNLAASYLTGFMLGKKVIDKEGKVNAIFDIGLGRNIPKSRAYAFLRGVIDAGLAIACEKEVLPEEAKIKSRQNNFDKIKEKIEND